MYELKNLLGPGPRLTKKYLPGRGLTKFEKHWFRTKQAILTFRVASTAISSHIWKTELQHKAGYKTTCVGIRQVKTSYRNVLTGIPSLTGR